MLHVLSIGNSFSDDAQRYLHQLSLAEGIAIDCVNLYIGGCSLKTHWENARHDEPAYAVQHNGHPLLLDDKPVTAYIWQVLQGRKWDVITLQQASHDSGDYATYQPFLGHLAEYIRRWAPGARLMIQQTWAYEKDSNHPGFARYQYSQQRMYECLCEAYQKAAKAIQADLIPSGHVIQALRKTAPFDYENGGLSLCRDGFHMSLDYGRYALAATWYTALTGKRTNAPMLPLDGCDAPDPALLQLICDTAAETVGLE